MLKMLLTNIRPIKNNSDLIDISVEKSSKNTYDNGDVIGMSRRVTLT